MNLFAKYWSFLLLALFISSCGGDFLEEQEIEKMPETVEEDFPDQIRPFDKPKSLIKEFDSIPQLEYSHLKRNSTIRDSPGGQIMFKVHSDSIWVNCSIDHSRKWVYVSAELDDSYEYRKVNRGLVYEELWKNNKKMASYYKIKNRKGKYVPHGTSIGFTHVSNINRATMPERALEDLIEAGDLSRTAFDEYLWTFKFLAGTTELADYENIRQFYIHPNEIDGLYTIDRLFLIFQNEQLVAFQSQLPTYISHGSSYKCNNGLTLRIIADWDQQKKDQFAEAISSCN